MELKASAAGTASQIPFIPKNPGRTIKNINNNAKERRNVITPDKYPFPYAIIRIAEKILIPENKNPNPYIRIPDTANVYTGLPASAKKETPSGAPK